jgi:hypothetical protein
VNKTQKMVKSNIEFGDFRLKCEHFLSELSAFHSAKERQIEHSFFKLFDNIPEEIKNAPINKFIDDYVRIVEENEEASKQANNKKAPQQQVKQEEQIVNESIVHEHDGSLSRNKEEIDDHETTSNQTAKILNVQDVTNIICFDGNKQTSVTSYKNLTSTVKKVSSSKEMKFMKQKLDAILNAESIIKQEEEENEADDESCLDDLTTVKQHAQDKTIQPTDMQRNQADAAKSDDYALKVVYFMRDLSSVSLRLNQLNQVDLSKVHPDSVDDLNRLCELMKNKK